MEIVWVMRLSIVVVAFSATTMAITIPSIYGLWSMCSDLVYVILFPQLIMVVHFKEYCNTYGSLSAYIVAFYIRMAGGEPLLGLKPLIHFPGWDGEKQLFPFRTTAMLCSLFTLVFVSWLTKWVRDRVNGLLVGKGLGGLSPQLDENRCLKFSQGFSYVRTFLVLEDQVDRGPSPYRLHSILCRFRTITRYAMMVRRNNLFSRPNGEAIFWSSFWKYFKFLKSFRPHADYMFKLISQFFCL